MVKLGVDASLGVEGLPSPRMRLAQAIIRCRLPVPDA